MNNDVNVLHTALENTLLLLRRLANEYHKDLDDSDLYSLFYQIREIERLV